MRTLIEGAGPFIWPLGICSFVAAFIVIERLIVLRIEKVLPDGLLAILSRGNLDAIEPEMENTVGGRIVRFFQKNNPDAETLKAYAQLELTRMERGLFILDTIVGIAPLLGLLGTVYGLFILFPEKGLPDTALLTRGVGLALTTTMIGLFIAIPSLICSNYLARRVEIISAKINMAVERLCSLSPSDESAVAPVEKR
ncbi:MAG: MotA/TolQ/ExbB proton channel family protein [Puniceicoccales bacterium]|jgi:biopolymer transport protein ExbB|nr:MotA/TolQ/ExbB proton channel family protein [Puniceicoccales bacterium]